jgi:serine/threonine-protein kinase RsbT
MAISKTETIPVRASAEVVQVRHLVRKFAVDIGLSLIELARNMVDYGGGGTLRVEVLDEGMRRGLRLSFEDQGPGIADIDQALRDGYTSGNGMGLGLGGAKRLSNEFELESKPGEGTRVTITRWRGTA